MSSTIVSCGGEFGLNGRVQSYVDFLLEGGSIVMLMVWSGWFSAFWSVQTNLGACSVLCVVVCLRQIQGACPLDVSLRFVCSGLGGVVVCVETDSGACPREVKLL